MSDSKTACQIVLHTPELLTLILADLPYGQILSATLVSKQFQATILTTPSLQRKLFLLPPLPSTSDSTAVESDIYFPPNYLLHIDDHLNCHFLYTCSRYDKGKYRPRGCVRVGMSSYGPGTSFPYKSQSSSWRNMVLFSEPRMVKRVRVREKVELRSWNRSGDEEWIGKWVRDRVVEFDEGLRCGGLWDLGKEGELGEGSRMLTLVVRWQNGDDGNCFGGGGGVECGCTFGDGDQYGKALVLMAIITPDGLKQQRRWLEWLEILIARGIVHGRRRKWKEWICLLVGVRKRIEGRFIRWTHHPCVCDHFLQQMRKDEDAVVEVTVKSQPPERKRWGHLRLSSRGEQSSRVRNLEKLGFVREAEKQFGECPHW